MHKSNLSMYCWCTLQMATLFSRSWVIVLLSHVLSLLKLLKDRSASHDVTGVTRRSLSIDQGLLFKDQDKDKNLSSKDKDKDSIVKDKDQDKNCILVLKESLRTRTRTNITAKQCIDMLIFDFFVIPRSRLVLMATETTCRPTFGGRCGSAAQPPDLPFRTTDHQPSTTPGQFQSRQYYFVCPTTHDLALWDCLGTSWMLLLTYLLTYMSLCGSDNWTHSSLYSLLGIILLSQLVVLRH